MLGKKLRVIAMSASKYEAFPRGAVFLSLLAAALAIALLVAPLAPTARADANTDRATSVTETYRSALCREPEAGALLMKALDAARETLYRRRRADEAITPVSDPAQEAPSHAQQQADALSLLAETALHHGLDPGASGERYQVVVHVDAPTLADPDQPGQSVLEDGTHVSAETSRRLACDATRVVMRHDRDGHLLEVGARTRTIPPALRRALLHRDRGCRFPGCVARVGQGHHVRHWAQGGPTTLSNLALLCRRHHRSVHEEGYQVERGSDGGLRFRRPDGRPLPETPPPAPVPADPVGTLRAGHESRGLRLHARTACPSWQGERLDVGWAIDVLHPLANPA